MVSVFDRPVGPAVPAAADFEAVLLGVPLSFPFRLGTSLAFPFRLGTSLAFPFPLGASLAFPFSLGTFLVFLFPLGASLAFSFSLGTSLALPLSVELFPFFDSACRTFADYNPYHLEQIDEARTSVHPPLGGE